MLRVAEWEKIKTQQYVVYETHFTCDRIKHRLKGMEKDIPYTWRLKEY